eukprot:1449491-Pleurochrysis_carterae.AAC.3
MDKKEIYRYCRWPPDKLNKRLHALAARPRLVARTGQVFVGVARRGESGAQSRHRIVGFRERHFPLAFRRAQAGAVGNGDQENGREMKTAADGLCGAILLGEIPQPARDQREMLELKNHWGLNTALYFCLVKPLLGTERVVGGADTRFMSVDAVQAMLVKVRANLRYMHPLSK